MAGFFHVSARRRRRSVCGDVSGRGGGTGRIVPLLHFDVCGGTHLGDSVSTRELGQDGPSSVGRFRSGLMAVEYVSTRFLSVPST